MADRKTPDYVIDGDTFEDPDVGRVRVSGVDTPEDTPGHGAEVGGIQATELARQTLDRGYTLGDEEGETHGRTIRSVYDDEGRNLGNTQLRHGMGTLTKWSGPEQDAAVGLGVVDDMLGREASPEIESLKQSVQANRERNIERLFSGEFDDRLRNQSFEYLGHKDGTGSRALDRGVAQLRASGNAFMQAFGDVTGIDTLSEKGREGVDAAMLDAIRNPATVESWDDVDGLADLGTYAMERGVAETPGLALDAAAALGTAGASVPASIGTRALRAGIGKALMRRTAGSEAVSQASAISTRAAAKLGGGASMYVQQTGGTVLDQEAAGVDAPGRAFGIGALQTGLEYTAAKSILGDVGRKFGAGEGIDSIAKYFASTAESVGHGASREGLTELTQSLIGELNKIDATEGRYELDPEQLLEGTITGATVGGAFGGAGAGVGNIGGLLQGADRSASGMEAEEAPAETPEPEVDAAPEQPGPERNPMPDRQSATSPGPDPVPGRNRQPVESETVDELVAESGGTDPEPPSSIAAQMRETPDKARYIAPKNVNDGVTIPKLFEEFGNDAYYRRTDDGGINISLSREAARNAPTSASDADQAANLEYGQSKADALNNATEDDPLTVVRERNEDGDPVKDYVTTGKLADEAVSKARAEGRDADAVDPVQAQSERAAQYQAEVDAARNANVQQQPRQQAPVAIDEPSPGRPQPTRLDLDDTTDAPHRDNRPLIEEASRQGVDPSLYIEQQDRASEEVLRRDLQSKLNEPLADDPNTRLKSALDGRELSDLDMQQLKKVARAMGMKELPKKAVGFENSGTEAAVKQSRNKAISAIATKVGNWKRGKALDTKNKRGEVEQTGDSTPLPSNLRFLEGLVPEVKQIEQMRDEGRIKNRAEFQSAARGLMPSQKEIRQRLAKMDESELAELMQTTRVRHDGKFGSPRVRFEQGEQVDSAGLAAASKGSRSGAEAGSVDTLAEANRQRREAQQVEEQDRRVVEPANRELTAEQEERAKALEGFGMGPQAARAIVNSEQIQREGTIEMEGPPRNHRVLRGVAAGAIYSELTGETSGPGLQTAIRQGSHGEVAGDALAAADVSVLDGRSMISSMLDAADITDPSARDEAVETMTNSAIESPEQLISGLSDQLYMMQPEQHLRTGPIDRQPEMKTASGSGVSDQGPTVRGEQEMSDGRFFGGPLNNMRYRRYRSGTLESVGASTDKVESGRASDQAVRSKVRTKRLVDENGNPQNLAYLTVRSSDGREARRVFDMVGLAEYAQSGETAPATPAQAYRNLLANLSRMVDGPRSWQSLPGNEGSPFIQSLRSDYFVPPNVIIHEGDNGPVTFGQAQREHYAQVSNQETSARMGNEMDGISDRQAARRKALGALVSRISRGLSGLDEQRRLATLASLDEALVNISAKHRDESDGMDLTEVREATGPLDPGDKQKLADIHAYREHMLQQERDRLQRPSDSDGLNAFQAAQAEVDMASEQVLQARAELQDATGSARKQSLDAQAKSVAASIDSTVRRTGSVAEASSQIESLRRIKSASNAESQSTNEVVLQEGLALAEFNLGEAKLKRDRVIDHGAQVDSQLDRVRMVLETLPEASENPVTSDDLGNGERFQENRDVGRQDQRNPQLNPSMEVRDLDLANLDQNLSIAEGFKLTQVEARRQGLDIDADLGGETSFGALMDGYNRDRRSASVLSETMNAVGRSESENDPGVSKIAGQLMEEGAQRDEAFAEAERLAANTGGIAEEGETDSDSGGRPEEEAPRGDATDGSGAQFSVSMDQSGERVASPVEDQDAAERNDEYEPDAAQQDTSAYLQARQRSNDIAKQTEQFGESGGEVKRLAPGLDPHAKLLSLYHDRSGPRGPGANAPLMPRDQRVQTNKQAFIDRQNAIKAQGHGTSAAKTDRLETLHRTFGDGDFHVEGAKYSDEVESFVSQVVNDFRSTGRPVMVTVGKDASQIGDILTKRGLLDEENAKRATDSLATGRAGHNPMYMPAGDFVVVSLPAQPMRSNVNANIRWHHQLGHELGHLVFDDYAQSLANTPAMRDQVYGAFQEATGLDPEASGNATVFKEWFADQTANHAIERSLNLAERGAEGGKTKPSAFEHMANLLRGLWERVQSLVPRFNRSESFASFVNAIREGQITKGNEDTKGRRASTIQGNYAEARREAQAQLADLQQRAVDARKGLENGSMRKEAHDAIIGDVMRRSQRINQGLQEARAEGQRQRLGERTDDFAVEHYKGTPGENVMKLNQLNQQIKRGSHSLTSNSLTRASGKLVRTVIGRIESFHPEMAKRLYTRSATDRSSLGEQDFQNKSYALRDRWTGQMERSFQRIYDAAGIKGLKKGKEKQAAVRKAIQDFEDGRIHTRGGAEIAKMVNAFGQDAGNEGLRSVAIDENRPPVALDHMAVDKDRARFGELIREAFPEASDRELNNRTEMLLDSQGNTEFAIAPGMPVSYHDTSRRMMERLGARRLREEGFLNDQSDAVMYHFIDGLAKRTAWEANFGGHTRRVNNPAEENSRLAGIEDPQGNFAERQGLVNEEGLYFDPNGEFHRMMDEVEQKHGPDATKQIHEMLDGVLGRKTSSMPRDLRNINDWVSAWTGWTVLAFSGLASLPELGLPATRAHGRVGLMEGVRGLADARRMAKDMGVVMSDASERIMWQTMGDNYESSTLNKIGTTFFKYNGQQAVTNTVRALGVSFGMRYLLKSAEIGDTQALSQLGVTAEEVRAWDRQGRPSWTAGADSATNETAGRVQAAITQFVHEGSSEPSKFQNPGWFNNPYLKAFWMIKRYMYAYGEGIIGGMWRQGKRQWARSEGLPAEQRAFLAAAPALAFAAATIPLAMVGTEIREWMRPITTGRPGKDIEDYGGPTEYAKYLFSRAGGFGPLEVLLSMREQSQWGNSPIGSFSPVAGKAEMLLDWGAEGYSNDKMLNKVRKMTPVANQFPALFK